MNIRTFLIFSHFTTLGYQKVTDTTQGIQHFHKEQKALKLSFVFLETSITVFN